MTVTWPRRLSDIGPTPDRFASSRGGHFQRTFRDGRENLARKRKVQFPSVKTAYCIRRATGILQDQNMGASTAPPRRAYVQALDQGA